MVPDAGHMGQVADAAISLYGLHSECCPAEGAGAVLEISLPEVGVLAEEVLVDSQGEVEALLGAEALVEAGRILYHNTN